jgi:hypothetical protein
VNTVTSDILPTLCALAGVQIPEIPLDGVDLVPLLNGEMTKRSEAIEFWSFRGSRFYKGPPKPYIDPELQKGTTPLVKKWEVFLHAISGTIITLKSGSWILWDLGQS